MMLTIVVSRTKIVITLARGDEIIVIEVPIISAQTPVVTSVGAS